MLLFFAVDVSAITSNVTIISDEVYTGATLKLRSLESGELGNSHYPFFVGENIGIIKIEVETGLSEANFSLRFTNNSEICLNIEEGPFVINGSDIMIDLRKVGEIIVENEIVVFDEYEEASNETASEIEEGDATSDTKGLVGYASKDPGIVQNNIYILFGLSILFAGIFMFFIVQKAYKSGAKGAAELLGRMEMDRKIDKLDDK